VRRGKAHGKHMSLTRAGFKAHNKVFLKEWHLVYSKCVRGEKYFVVRYKKCTANKIFVARRVFL
jgi:hypothetical protein